MATRAQKPAAPATPAEVRIERLAADYRAALDAAGTICTRHQEEVGAISARYAPTLRAAAAAIRRAGESLKEAIRAARDVYLSPTRRTKTDILHGVRVGWKQMPGRWQMPDQQALLAAVRERIPDQAETLIETAEAVRVDALTDDQRKLLGGQWIEPTQTVVCAEQATGIERLLASLVPAEPAEPEGDDA